MSVLFTGPLSIDPIIERLRVSVPQLKLVAGAADLAAATEKKFPLTPATFVLLATEKFGKVVSTTQRFRQNVTASFFVVTALRDHNIGKRGIEKSPELKQILAAQRAALLKWAHPEANRTGMRMGGTGKLLSYENALLGWQDVFQAEYQIQIEKSS